MTRMRVTGGRKALFGYPSPAATRRGIPTHILDAIQGHAPRTAAEGYGEVTMKAMAQAMERLPRVEV
jgi:hypothetical protein